jgi:hypothetical protein
MEISDKVISKIKLDGIRLQKGNKEETVRIDGDSVERSIVDSFEEGVLKGLATGLTGAGYPLIATTAKALDAAFETAKKAREMGADDKSTLIAGLKGALVGGIKGLADGVVDYLVIAGLSSVAMSLIGLTGLFPFGILLNYAIGGVYNLAIDALRKSLGQTPNPHQLFPFEKTVLTDTN